ncbi:MAG: hypothetical protein ACRD2N_06100, partial [Vicinamibacterales bacterium]
MKMRQMIGLSAIALAIATPAMAGQSPPAPPSLPVLPVQPVMPALPVQPVVPALPVPPVVHALPDVRLPDSAAIARALAAAER